MGVAAGSWRPGGSDPAVDCVRPSWQYAVERRNLAESITELHPLAGRRNTSSPKQLALGRVLAGLPEFTSATRWSSQEH